jgi:hypothetical protein
MRAVPSQRVTAVDTASRTVKYNAVSAMKMAPNSTDTAPTE